MEIKIHRPISSVAPTAWTAELNTDLKHLNYHYRCVDYDDRRFITDNLSFKHNIKSQVVACIEKYSFAFEEMYMFSHWNVFDSIGEWYDHHIVEQITFNKDKPGFNMDPHLDNRCVFGVIIINLEENETGTYFPKLNYQDAGIKNRGIFFFNHNLNRHAIDHSGTKDRYTMQILLYLKHLIGKQ